MSASSQSPQPHRLVVETQGEGRPVVVVPWGPGGFGSLYRWALQPLARRVQLVHWDFRGCGRSTPAARYTMEDDLWDLCSVLDALEGPRPVLLGHSYGGMVALYLACEYPELIDGLVLVNTAARGAALREGLARRKKAMGLREFKRWEHLGLRAVAGEASGDEKLRWLEIEAGHLVRDPADVQAILRRVRVNFEVAASVQPSLQAFDVTKRLGKLEVPALVTAGAHDRILADAPRDLHLALPGSAFHRFRESAHMPFLEEPLEFHRVVGGWLAALDSTPPSQPA